MDSDGTNTALSCGKYAEGNTAQFKCRFTTTEFAVYTSFLYHYDTITLNLSRNSFLYPRQHSDRNILKILTIDNNREISGQVQILSQGSFNI